MIQLQSDVVTLTFDPEFGMISSFVVSDQGQSIAPLHRAPWVGAGEDMPSDAAPHLAKLGGDFFCAPFGLEADGAPLHGWPANTVWSLESQDGLHLTAKLPRLVAGASLTKSIGLKTGHPFVYQSHVFSGGSGRLPFANHANVALLNGGLIRTSAKSKWRTPSTPVEAKPSRGRSGLAYPGESDALARFPSRDGFVDLGQYPWFAGCEDFVVGIEAASAHLGWTAVTRPLEGDLFLSLRCADRMPMTMFWHSNGGRDYAPWSGRHLGCLGVEEGAASHILGETSDLSDSAAGVMLVSESAVEVRHVTGAISWPSGEAVDQIDLAGDAVVVRGDQGAERQVPLDVGFVFG